MNNDISEKDFIPPKVNANWKLRELNLEWHPPRIHTVYDDEYTAVYVAVGYGRSNPVLIIGKKENGCIIVDPGESKLAAEIVKTAYSLPKHLGPDFFKNTPVKAIIYTHYHDCHIHGASVFADGNEDVEIISQEKLPDNLFSLTGALYNMAYPIKSYRAIKYMGLKFQSNSNYFVNGGIFSHSRPGHSGYIPPTITVKNELTTTIAGVDLNLIYAPGETTDIIFVWLPNEKVMVQIGDFYKSFPAITTLRGASFRNPLDYIKSIDKMISLDADHLILIHGGTPLSKNKGDDIRGILTGARDANQYIHDQTLQCMNKGMTPGEIIEHVKLPDYLGNQEYVQEYFGDIERVIFQIFSQYMGWFSGKSRDIFPISTLEQAKASANLAGGEENLVIKARDALENNKPKWALIFADDVLLLNSENKDALKIKCNAMLELAQETINAQTRNYLLSEYLEESRQLKIKIPAFYKIDDRIIPYMPIDNIFKIMGVQLDAVKSLNTEIVVGLNDNSNSDSGYTMEIRRCILDVKKQKPDNPNFTIIADSYDDWKKVILGKVTPQDAVHNNLIKINGGNDEDFYNFMNYFLISYVENNKNQIEKIRVTH